MAKRTFKTTKVVSGGQFVYREWKKYETGDVLVVKLIGKRVSKYNQSEDEAKKKYDWLCTVEEAFLVDKKFQKEIIGKNICMNSAGQLDKGMKEIEMNTHAQVTYNGMETIKGGNFKGKESHLHEVMCCEEVVEGSEESFDDNYDPQYEAEVDDL